ncbi:MAG: nicotinate-nicotinamide nucleotide adenylyltransferase [Desulfovibrio sp.]|nr:nicotinate-nicotinamide nucleotide adenylyltransferase [Desulfovibrio sp.]
MTPAPRGILIFGGSFNPLHIGHLRLALEALDWLSEHVERVDLVPAGEPPHKPGHCLLPFALRSGIIRASIAGVPGLACNEIEGSLAGPSYTHRTLEILGRQYGRDNLYFLLGSQDFLLLPEWKDGLDLPSLCNLVIVPRGDYNKSDFEFQSHKFWPDCKRAEFAPLEKCLHETGAALRHVSGTHLFWLPLPVLDISATRIRKLWLCDRNVDYLVPAPGLKILNAACGIARQCWQEKECSK